MASEEREMGAAQPAAPGAPEAGAGGAAGAAGAAAAPGAQAEGAVPARGATPGAQGPGDAPAAQGAAPDGVPQGPTVEQVKKALEIVKDPELRINVVDLGLVYDVQVEGGKVFVLMTLTSPACPVGPLIVAQAESVLRRLPGVEDVRVELTFDPPWHPDMMSERLKRARAMGLL